MDATITFNRFEKVRDELDTTLAKVVAVVREKITEEWVRVPAPLERRWRKDYQPRSLCDRFTEDELTHYLKNGVGEHSIADKMGTKMMRLLDMYTATITLRVRMMNGFNEGIHLRAVSVTLTQDDITSIGFARTWLEPTS